MLIIYNFGTDKDLSIQEVHLVEQKLRVTLLTQVQILIPSYRQALGSGRSMALRKPTLVSCLEKGNNSYFKRIWDLD